MTMHTLSDHVQAKTSFAGALTNGSQNGKAIDSFGFRRASLLYAGKTVTSTAQVKVQSATDSVFTTPVDFPGATLVAPLAASENQFEAYIDLDLTEGHQYLRAVVTGTAADSAVAAVFLLHQGNAEPVDQTVTAVKA